MSKATKENGLLSDKHNLEAHEFEPCSCCRALAQVRMPAPETDDEAKSGCVQENPGQARPGHASGVLSASAHPQQKQTKNQFRLPAFSKTTDHPNASSTGQTDSPKPD